jgi:hypothetical protein
MKRMKSILKLSLAGLITLLFMTVAQAQMTSVTATLDTNAIMIGDQIGLNLKANVPQGFHLQWPEFKDTIAPHIEMIKTGKIDSANHNGFTQFTRHITITSFDSGYFTVPPIHFSLIHKGTGKVDTLSTQMLYLHVYTPMVDTAKAFKEIKGIQEEPYTFGEIMPWVLLVLIGIAAIIFLTLFIRNRKKNKPLFTKKPKPKLPPYEQAIKKLEELRLSRLWQSGKLKDYYTDITDIMKEYFTDRFDFDAWEMTSDEILERLQQEKLNAQAMGKLNEALELSDLVKFAKAVPSPLENETTLNYCVDFVNESKNPPQIESEDQEKDTEPGEVEDQEEKKTGDENVENKEKKGGE